MREVLHLCFYRVCFSSCIPIHITLGNLLYIKQLRPWPLRAVLHDKYLFPPQEADSIAGFLLPMLEVDPAARMSAEDLVRHEWLADAHDADVVGGERVDDAMKPAYGPGEVPLVTSSSEGPHALHPG